MLRDNEHGEAGEQHEAGGGARGQERLGSERQGARAEAPASRERGRDGRLDARPTPSDDDAAAAKEGRIRRWSGFLRRHPIATAVSLAVLALVGFAGYLYWDYARHFESTDDAFVDARQFSVAPKISGYITAVTVTDNQHLEAGDVIARIDDRDYRIALEQAEAQVAAAQASIQNIDAQIAAQQAQVGEAQAQVEQARAALTFAQQESTRYEELVRRGAGTVQQAQQTSSNLQQQEANLERAQAAVTAAERQIGSLQAQRHSAEASLSQAQAQRNQAQLNLSYTAVTAAQAGRVVRLTAAIGQLAQAGTSLAMMVPDEIWVTANFKETQLAAMRPGQPAVLKIDAYPGHTIHGHVGSIQPGSGTAFSLLPAENATGNYVKVVQRVPVKITMDDPPSDVSIGPGMSVVPTVRVVPQPSLFERLTGRA